MYIYIYFREPNRAKSFSQQHSKTIEKTPKLKKQRGLDKSIAKPLRKPPQTTKLKILQRSGNPKGWQFVSGLGAVISVES